MRMLLPRSYLLLLLLAVVVVVAIVLVAVEVVVVEVVVDVVEAVVEVLTWNGIYEFGAIAGARIGKCNLEPRSGK